MKKFFNIQNKISLFLPVAAFVFLLQSCCIPLYSDVSKKPCNCNDKPALAGNNQKSPSHPVAIQETSERVLNTSAANSTNIIKPPSGITNEDQQTVTISADPLNHFTQTVQTLQHIPVPYVNDPALENEPGELSLSGQTSHRKPFEKKLPLGIKRISTSLMAAPNMSFKSSKEDYGNADHRHKPGVGFQFGIGTTYSFTDKVAVGTSLLFEQNNATEVLTYTSPGEPGGNPIVTEYESRYSYNYLSAPILAEVKLSNQISLVAGPEINYLLGASVKSNGNGSENKTSITKNSVKLGTGFQLGIKYGIPGSPLAAQLIYDHRISGLNKKNESTGYEPGGGGGGYETPAWNMKSIQLGITCALCELLKKKK